MKILLSPAKMLDYERNISTPKVSSPLFLEQSEELVKKLQKFSKNELEELMNISKNLTLINYERYKNWQSPTSLSDTSKPAITVFSGQVYIGLDCTTFSEQDFLNAQNKIRILSGLYGILRPLDLIYPYRLEMGTKWQLNSNTKTLYQFWQERLTNFLKKDLQKDEVIINLASKEYFKAIDLNQLNTRVITPVFKELKGDKMKVVMMYAKHARGTMARDIIQNDYQSVDDLKGYNIDGYCYIEDLSTEDEWVFVR